MNVVNPYLFLKQELDYTTNGTLNNYQTLKNQGIIRHCKVLNNGKLYDYIVKQEYNSVEDWLASYNPSTPDVMKKPTLHDVCYGQNRHLYQGSFATNYVMPFADAKVDLSIDSKLQDLADHLRSKKMSVDSVMINFNRMILPLDQFMRI